ncbi:MAG: GIY-YIG nuclease family protein [Pseudomonadota bacterium]
MATAGRSLELYYIDGRPDGMLTAEMFNWTGHVLMAPRTQLADALVRAEAGYAGVYLLLGEREGEPLAYVGEGEDISARIKSHDVAKDWWTNSVLVTTAGNKLNKAHVRYLEARLIEEARKIGRTPLDNGTAPSRPSLSEADIAKMEAFLENLLVVLPALRVDMFIQRAGPRREVVPEPKLVGDVETRFDLHNRRHDLRATAVFRSGAFFVEAGSQARLKWEGEVGHSYQALHEELVREGVLVEDGGHRVFAMDYLFKSPSAAAAVVNGRAANGTVEWKTEAGENYKQWEAKRLGLAGLAA